MEIQLLKKFADGANGNKLINKPPINKIFAFCKWGSEDFEKTDLIRKYKKYKYSIITNETPNIPVSVSN